MRSSAARSAPGPGPGGKLREPLPPPRPYIHVHNKFQQMLMKVIIPPPRLADLARTGHPSQAPALALRQDSDISL